MRTAVALLVASVLASVASAQPGVPALTGRVVDTADILTPATEAAITARLASFEDSTSVQIAVLTIPALNGQVLESYATEVFRTWGLGEADRDNGVLLLIARDDRTVRIEVGYGLEGSLTDATSGSIIRHELVPRFRDGDFDGGVLAGVEAIVGSVDGTYVARSSSGISMNGRPAEETPFLGRLLFGLLFGVFPLLGIGIPVLSRGATGVKGDVGAGCAGVFAGAFVGAGLVIVLLTGWGIALGLLGVPLALIVLNRWLETHPTWGPIRRHNREKSEAFAAARRQGATTVVVGGRSYDVPTASAGGSSGGGFSGGGGSSGGGGASGSW